MDSAYIVSNLKMEYWFKNDDQKCSRKKIVLKSLHAGSDFGQKSAILWKKVSRMKEFED